MLVSPTAIFGTIGGGQLEFMAIDKARQMLAARRRSGRARRSTSRSARRSASAAAGGSRCRSALVDAGCAARPACADAQAEDARVPHVYLFGGGHVGQALAAALSLLPVQVDRRRDARRGAGRHAGRRRDAADAGAGGDGASGAGGLGLRRADPRPRARFPDRRRGAEARATPPMSA